VEFHFFILSPDDYSWSFQGSQWVTSVYKADEKKLLLSTGPLSLVFHYCIYCHLCIMISSQDYLSHLKTSLLEVDDFPQVSLP
jgi:hypothetical protein